MDKNPHIHTLVTEVSFPSSFEKLALDSKHRAGKVVTLITGFIGKQEDLEILGKNLKTKCGTGGSAKDAQIIIQGDYKVKVVQLLQQLKYKVKI